MHRASTSLHVAIGTHRCVVASSAFIAPTAHLTGSVSVGQRCGIWFGAVLRGDISPIAIGEETNVQDNAVIHVEKDAGTSLGRRVTVGHCAVVHATAVDDEVIIGIGAIVLSKARIGARSIIASGAVVPEGAEIPPGSLVMGVPGRVVRAVTEQELERIRETARGYVELARAYREALARGEPV